MKDSNDNEDAYKEPITPVTVIDVGFTEIYSGPFDGKHAVCITYSANGQTETIGITEKQALALMLLLNQVCRDLNALHSPLDSEGNIKPEFDGRNEMNRENNEPDTTS